jgi:tRNA-2-methylthio-N6-dimethylallyladenosine synthase
VLRQVRAYATAGYKEVTLLGQTVNSYRYEDVRFSDLLRAVARTEGIERVRFTSPYPVDFSDDVVAAIAEEPKVCKHVHLPLQSGSDAVLARMKRGYTYAEFAAIARALREASPGIAITTDLIAGFCGETEGDHQRTLEAIEEMRFASAFTFVYSEREGTAAARKIEDDVPADVKRRRLTEIIQAQRRHTLFENQRYVGRVERVLLHAVSKKSDTELVGRTDTFKAVLVPRGDYRPGDVLDVRIERASVTTLFGAAA